MTLAEVPVLSRDSDHEHPAAVLDQFPAPSESPVTVLNPTELRQLWQCYDELLELHHAEVVEDENFDDAHRLMVEQVLPLRAILHEQQRLIVDPRSEQTY